MIYYFSLFILCTFMIFTAMRFMVYYRITKEYKNTTTAKVIASSPHVPETKEEKKQKLMDVTLECTVNDAINHSEITVPCSVADEYKLGAEIPISYKVSPNGTVHVASSTKSVKKFAIFHFVILIAEIAAFLVIWFSML